mmetsp:Transcript_3397/g.8805  ORF Transcript_3397/g.8805 Transcript_3397/m.8805 type:complete len:125 (-) Transcript_3397:1975-2349(-)
MKWTSPKELPLKTAKRRMRNLNLRAKRMSVHLRKDLVHVGPAYQLLYQEKRPDLHSARKSIDLNQLWEDRQLHLKIIATLVVILYIKMMAMSLVIQGEEIGVRKAEPDFNPDTTTLFLVNGLCT